MVAAAPVLDGFGKGPSRGLVILAGCCPTPRSNESALMRRCNFSMFPSRQTGDPNGSLKTGDVIKVYRTLKDLYGRPIVSLQVDVRGDNATWLLGSLLRHGILDVAAIMVVVLLVFILNRVVFETVGFGHPPCNRNREARISPPGSTSKGNDEIGVLAREFDRMVARVAESRSH